MKNKITEILFFLLNKILKNKKYSIDSINLIKKKIIVEQSRNRKFGDYSSNIALILSKILQKNSFDIARDIVNLINNFIKKNNISFFDNINISQPGFINFIIKNENFINILNTAYDVYKKNYILTVDKKIKKTVHIEYVSANPTGPIHIGHGRNAVYGDTLSNLLKKVGYKVYNEYYINDRGSQIDILTISVIIKYFIFYYNKNIAYPDFLYQGKYIINIINKIYEMFYKKIDFKDKEFCYYNNNIDSSDKLVCYIKNNIKYNIYEKIKNYSISYIIKNIKNDLLQMRIKYNNWISENSFIKDKILQNTIKKFYKENNCYKKNDAIWFCSKKFGDNKDRVLIKKNKESTYFFSDIIYHQYKFSLNYDKIINIFGSDHHGYIARINAFIKSQKLEVKKIQYLLVQFVTLQKNKMSKRSGKFITLKELMKEINIDTIRYFYLSQHIDKHIDFNIDIAKSYTKKNPVYYIQYAYIRIYKILKKSHFIIKDAFIMLNKYNNYSFNILEKEIIILINDYTCILKNASKDFNISNICNYIYLLVKKFHVYYESNNFLHERISKNKNKNLIILFLIKNIIKDCFKIFNITTPKKI